MAAQMDQLDRIEKALEQMRAELAELKRRGEYASLPDSAVSFEVAARRLDISVKTLRRMIRLGELMTVVISKCPKIPESELRRKLTPKPVVRPVPASRRKKGAASTGRYEAKLAKMRSRL